MKNLKKSFTNNFFLAIFAFLVLIFFYPFFLFGKVPIPADTIVGMYHPFKDIVWNDYQTGVPFKNFLITDPVRQQYVWRKLAFEQLKKGNLPLWNPYSFAGTPLLSNFQSASFYPLNLLFWLLPFNLAWGILVTLQPFLAGIFLYLYLRFLRISKVGSFLGGLTFAFAGFAIAWMEWNTIIHVAAWLPLMLLSIEKIILFTDLRLKIKNKKLKTQIKNKKIIWSIIFLFSLSSSFFAGHLQIFFYSFLVVVIYTIVRVFFLKQNKINTVLLFTFYFLLFTFITSIQWLPTLRFISLSARDFDQGLWLKEGWFIPWQHLIQFFAPDFFGNPTTGNYWGVWNYGEMIGYVGIAPFIMALFAMIWRKDKKTLFFGSIFFLSLIMATPTFLAKLPYRFKIPFISTSQPTRLLFLTDFSLAVLAALGFDYFLKNKRLIPQIIKLLAGLGTIYGGLWLFVFWVDKFNLSILAENILVAKRNLILPTALFIISSSLLIPMLKVKNNLLKFFIFYFLLFVIVFDLFRFAWKFTPFSKKEWIFPQTKVINRLQQDVSSQRIMSLDRRVMPPNFSSYYHLQDVSGYDPLYLKNYGHLVSSWEQGKADIKPASFNRIITPHSKESIISDLLGVKYYLSFGKVELNDLELLKREGQTFLYQNKNAFPRAFLVEQVKRVQTSQQEIEKMFLLGDELRFTAVTTEDINIKPQKILPKETVEIISYEENNINLIAKTEFERLLITTDIYYPSWRAYIDGKEAKIYKVDFALRAVLVPRGEHKVEFKAGFP